MVSQASIQRPNSEFETHRVHLSGPVDFRAGGDELDSYEAQYHTQAAVA